MAALGSVLMIVAFLGIQPSLIPKWAIYLGRISYGLYVYHILSIIIVDNLFIGRHVSKAIAYYPLRVCLGGAIDIVSTLGLTVLMASISYRYLETPFLKMKKRHAIIESQPIV